MSCAVCTVYNTLERRSELAGRLYRKPSRGGIEGLRLLSKHSVQDQRMSKDVQGCHCERAAQPEVGGAKCLRLSFVAGS